VKNRIRQGLGWTVLGVVMVAAIFGGHTSLAADEKEPPKKEVQEETSPDLPFGAVQRLGYSEWPVEQWQKHPPIMFAAAAYSPDGATLALLKTDGTVRLLDAQKGEEKQRFRLSQPAYAMDFAPDGNTLVTANGQAWDVKTGKESKRFKDMSGPRPRAEDPAVVRLLKFAPDGKVLATAEPDKVRLWDPDTGKKTQEAKIDLKIVFSLTYSPDGKSIALSGLRGETNIPGSAYIVVLDSGSLKESARFEKRKIASSNVAFSSDSKKLYACGTSKQILSFDLATSKESGPIHIRDDAAYRLAWDPKTKTLASLTLSSESGATICFWDEEGKEVETIKLGKLSDSVFALDFTLSPDGKNVAFLRSMYSLEAFSRKGVRGFTVTDENAKPVHALAFSADGKKVAAGSDHVVLWDAATGKEIRRLKGFVALSGLAFPPGEDRLVVFGRQKVSWVATKGDAKADERSPTIPSPKRWAVSPDGKALVVVDLDAAPEVWERGADKKPSYLVGQEAGRIGGQCVAISPDGRWIAVGSESDKSSLFVERGGLVTVWDAKTRNVFKFFGGNPRDKDSRINAVAFSPDSRFLAAANRTVIFLYNVQTGVAGGHSQARKTKLSH
jgi:WD40 repeat protein